MTTGNGTECSPLIVVLSPERSGSTLLSMMLGGHRRIIAPPEMHALAYEHFDAMLEDYPSALSSVCFAIQALGLPHDEEQVRREFRGWSTENVYRRLLERCVSSSLLLIDKTPRYARDTATLQRAERLKPFYIWLLRHPLAVAASRISFQHVWRRKLSSAHWSYRLKYPLYRVKERLQRPSEVRRHLRYWSDLHCRVEAFLSGIPQSRQMTVHYEDVVRQPQRSMDSIAAKFGLSFEPAMLNPRENLPAALQFTLGDWKIKERRSIDARAADTWRRDYDERLLDAQTRRLMARFGVTG